MIDDINAANVIVNLDIIIIIIYIVIDDIDVANVVNLEIIDDINVANVNATEAKQHHLLNSNTAAAILFKDSKGRILSWLFPLFV